MPLAARAAWMLIPIRYSEQAARSEQDFHSVEIERRNRLENERTKFNRHHAPEAVHSTSCML